MAVGTSNRTRLAYIAESTWGTTPGTGTMDELRYTGESLGANVTFTESAEIVSHRMTTDTVATQWGSGGDINFELSSASYDDFLEAAVQGTWTADVLKTGSTARSFTMEKQFLDATAAEFMAFTGMRIDGLRMDFRVGQIASGSFSFLGKKPTVSGTTVRAGTPTAPGTTAVIAPVNSMQVLEEGGGAVVGVSELTFGLSNSMRSLGVIDGADPFAINSGKQRISGTLNAYFQSRALMAKFLASTESSIEIGVGGASAARYDFLFPRVKFTKGTVVAGGSDQDLLVALEWTALRAASEAALIQITRYP